MIVCICKEVTTSDILELKELGYTAEEIIQATGCSSQCGTCYDEFMNVYKKVK